MSILRPRTQEVLPRWHLSVVLKGIMKPPFAINGSDRNLSLELLSYKTALFIALATGARGSELVALSQVPHNIEFKTLDSGAKHLSIRMVPNLFQRINVLNLFRNCWNSGNSSLVSKGSWKAPVSRTGAGPIPVTIRGTSKRRSITETLCAFLPGHPALHYTLQTLGSRDHLPDLRKFVGIGSTQDSSSWRQGDSCLHSLL